MESNSFFFEHLGSKYKVNVLSYSENLEIKFMVRLYKVMPNGSFYKLGDQSVINFYSVFREKLPNITWK